MKLLLVPFIWAAMGCLLQAIFLRAATKWTQKRDVSYGQAYMTTLMPTLVNTAIVVCIYGFLGIIGGAPTQATILIVVFIPVWLMIFAAFVSSRLKMTLDKALLVSLVVFGIDIALLLMIAIPVIIFASRP